jgi:hypothetical protein
VFRPTATRDVNIGTEGHPDKNAGLAVMRFEAVAPQTQLVAPASAAEAHAIEPAQAGADSASER